MSAPAQIAFAGEPVVKMRAGQKNFFRLVDRYRLFAFLARRQYGKTTTFANVALKKMMKTPNHTVIFGSAKLNLSREIVRKEAEIIGRSISEATRRLEANQFMVADADTGKIPDRLTADDFAGLFEAQRLEFRFFHSRSVYSRTKVVALRPDTVGETGDLMCDEIGFIQNWREVWKAIEPIVSSNPAYRLLLSTTPPLDDAHFAYEQLAPHAGTEFPVNPAGNLYESESDIDVLRVDAFDAWADGVPIYSLKTGEPLNPQEHRNRSHDKETWDRNYGVKFIAGGSAAIGLFQLQQAQSRGIELGCRYFSNELPADWVSGCRFKPGVPAVIGVDPATTEKKKSNPTGFCVSQMDGTAHAGRAMMRYKRSDPREARAIIIDAVRTLKAAGVPVKCVVIDATGEKYWAAETRQELRLLCPVLLVVSSEREEVNGENVLVKTALGAQAVSTFDDGLAAIPGDKEVKDDFRLPRKYKGGYDNEVDDYGNHGDLFDAYKLALRGHMTDCLETAAEAVQVGAASVSLDSSSRPDRMPMRPTEKTDEQRSELWT